MKTVVMIPCRMDSKRLLGKPLRKIIDNITLIELVYGTAIQANFETWIVTPDKEISDFLLKSCPGTNCVITSNDPMNGTERCYEAALSKRFNFNDDDIIINVQGDLAYFDPHILWDLNKRMVSCRASYASVIGDISEKDMHNQNKVKCSISLNRDHGVLIDRFSRHPIEDVKNFLHIGIYAYTFKSLKMYNAFGSCELEKALKLEQMRMIENMENINAVYSFKSAYSIDIEDDLTHLQGMLYGEDNTS